MLQHPAGRHPVDAHQLLLEATVILQQAARAHRAAGDLPLAVALVAHAKQMIGYAKGLSSLIREHMMGEGSNSTALAAAPVDSLPDEPEGAPW